MNPARGWLFGIARTQLADLHRRGAVERRAQDPPRHERLAIDDADLELIERTVREEHGHATLALAEPPDRPGR